MSTQRAIDEERYYTITITWAGAESTRASLTARVLGDPMGHTRRRSSVVLDIPISALERMSSRLRWLAIAASIQAAFEDPRAPLGSPESY